MNKRTASFLGELLFVLIDIAWMLFVLHRYPEETKEEFSLILVVNAFIAIPFACLIGAWIESWYDKNE